MIIIKPGDFTAITLKGIKPWRYFEEGEKNKCLVQKIKDISSFPNSLAMNEERHMKIFEGSKETMRNYSEIFAKHWFVSLWNVMNNRDLKVCKERAEKEREERSWILLNDKKDGKKKNVTSAPKLDSNFIDLLLKFSNMQIKKDVVA